LTMADLKQTYIFRITHVDNLPYIFGSGLLHAPLHPDADPDYIQIGDRQLTSKRGQTPVPVGPGGTFRDYVAFYFGPRQPMLYCIKHGFNGVIQRPMSEIIYLVSTVETVSTTGLPFVFYNGHAYDSFSSPFTDLADLGEVDTKAVKAKRWDDPADPDLKRRKQAEFLVHRQMPFSSITHILTHDAQTEQRVKHMLQGCVHQPAVQPQPNLYF